MPVTGPEPLAWNRSNAPVLAPALGVYIQLEPAVPGDEPRYEKACAIVRDWVGDKLRWTLTSTFGEPAPYDPEDFQYVVEHPVSTKPPEPASTPELEAMQRRLQVLQGVEFSMDCHGGEHAILADPTSFRFHTEISDDAAVLALALPTCLRVTVPTDWPIEDFHRRTLELLGVLRVRWAAAGYTYSGWEPDRYVEMQDSLFAHARRYPGFDTGYHVGFGGEFHRRIRTVSWLTAIGPAFLERVGEVRAAPGVTVLRAGDALVLQAGDRPAIGDVNRLDFPPAYCVVDQLLRSVRAPSTAEVHFRFPWSRQTTEHWLRRFEPGSGR